MIPLTDIPTLTSEKIRHLHHLMEAEGFSFDQQLQRSGEAVARLAAQLLTDSADNIDNVQAGASSSVADCSIVLLTGGGDTGIIGLHAARFLAEQNAWVQVLTLVPAEAHHGLAADALNSMLGADVPLAWADEGWELPPCDLLIDAMNGFDQRDAVKRNPQPNALLPLIELANSTLAPIFSVGTPSSAEIKNHNNSADTVFVKATATLSFGLPHASLLNGTVRAASGELYLADAGIPPKLFEQLDVAAPDLYSRFAVTPFIRL